MKKSKGVFVTKRDIILNQEHREYQLYTNKVITTDVVNKYGEILSKNVGIQYNSRKNNVLCTCRNLSLKHQEPSYNFSPIKSEPYQRSRSNTEVGVGSVKALQKKKVKRIYLPETNDRGVGSSDLSSLKYRRTRQNATSYYDQKKTSSKCVGGNPDKPTDCMVSTQLSPIVRTKSGVTSPKLPNIQNTEVGSNTTEKQLISTMTQMETEDLQKEESMSVEEKPKSILRPFPTKAALKIKPSSTENDLGKVDEHKKEMKPEKSFSSDSLLQRVHNLEESSLIKTSEPINNKNKEPKSGSSNFSDLKSTSLLKRRFEALKRTLGKKEDFKKDLAEASKISSQHGDTGCRDASVNSDPPSLEGRSFLNMKTHGLSSFMPHLIEASHPTYDSSNADKKDADWFNQAQAIDSEYAEGVKGMFKLWGKKFNLDEGDRSESPKQSLDFTNNPNKSPVKDSSLKEANVEEKHEKKGGKKFFFFKKKNKGKSKEKSKETSNVKDSFKSKKGVTAVRCEVTDGLMINFGGNKSGQSTPKSKRKSYSLNKNLPKEYDEANRKTRLLKQFKHPDSENSVQIKWNNTTYATSSSTVFELMSGVYKNTGAIFKSTSQVITDDSSLFTSSFYSKKQSMNYTQNIEAWMIPTIIDQPLCVRDGKYSEKDIKVRISNQKWFIDKSKAFAHNIKVVLHSNNLVTLNNAKSSNEYLRIDLPKGFFSDSSTSARDNNSISDEEVYKIVEYDTPESTSHMKKVKKKENLDASADILKNKVTISITDKEGAFDSKVVETVIKTPPILRDVVIQGSNVFIPKKCDVIGVGIITQRDIREVKKPILKLIEYMSDDDSDRSVHVVQKKCEFAESYLQDYYRNCAPLGIDFFSWCMSDSHLKCCSENNSYLSLNNIDGSKSCPNIYDDYQTSAIISSVATSSCSQCLKAMEQAKEDKKVEKKKEKELKGLKSKKLDNVRILPKDSLEVCKKRKLYACSNKAYWHMDDDSQPYSVPSSEERGAQGTLEDFENASLFKSTSRGNKKRVCVEVTHSHEAPVMVQKLSSESKPKCTDIPDCREGCMRDLNMDSTGESTVCPPPPSYPSPREGYIDFCRDQEPSPCIPTAQSPAKSPRASSQLGCSPQRCRQTPPRRISPPKYESPRRKKSSSRENSTEGVKLNINVKSPPPWSSEESAAESSPKRNSPPRKQSPAHSKLRGKYTSPTKVPCFPEPYKNSKCPNPVTMSRGSSPSRSANGSPKSKDKSEKCNKPPCNIPDPKPPKSSTPPTNLDRCSTPPCSLPAPVCTDCDNAPCNRRISAISSNKRITEISSDKKTSAISSVSCPFISNTEASCVKNCVNIPSNTPPPPPPELDSATKLCQKKCSFRNQVSGIYLKKLPSKRKTCSSECKAWSKAIHPNDITGSKTNECFVSSNSQLAMKQQNNFSAEVYVHEKKDSSLLTDFPAIDYNQANSEGTELSLPSDLQGDCYCQDHGYDKPLNFESNKVTQFNQLPQSVFPQSEKRDSVCNRNLLVEDMYKASKVGTENESKEKAKIKSEDSIVNTIEINFKLRLTQGDKTAEINIEDDNAKKIKNKRTDKEAQNVFLMKDSQNDKIEADDKNNDVNIRILIKNYKSKDKKKEFQKYPIKAEVKDDFSKKISEKFHTVSTGYSSDFKDEVFSHHRATIDLTQSSEDPKNMIAAITSVSQESKPAENFSRITDSRISNHDSISKTKSSSKGSLKDHKEGSIKSNSRANDSKSQVKFVENHEVISPKYSSTHELQPEVSFHTKTSDEPSTDLVEVPPNICDEKDIEVGYKTSGEHDTDTHSDDDPVKIIRPNKQNEQKKLLKKVFENENYLKPKKLSRIDKIKNMLKAILTSDSSDPEEIVVANNDLAGSVMYPSFKPDFFKNSESLNNYYKGESAIVSERVSSQRIKFPTEEYNSLCSEKDSDWSEPDKPPSHQCLCSHLAAALRSKMDCSGGGGGCCCSQKKPIATMSEQISCDLGVYEDFSSISYTNYYDVETQNSKYYVSQVTNVSTHKSFKHLSVNKFHDSKSDDAKSDVKSDYAKSDGVKSDDIKSDDTRSDYVKSDNAKSDHAMSDNAKSDDARSGDPKFDEVKSDNDTKLDDLIKGKVEIEETKSKSSTGIAHILSNETKKKFTFKRGHKNYIRKFKLDNVGTTRLGISDDDRIVFLEEKATTLHLETKSIANHSSQRSRMKISNPADILQLYETKKAVLEIYAEKTQRRDGGKIVAKLPKFVQGKESDICRSYKQFVQNNLQVRKKKVVMMTVNR